MKSLQSPELASAEFKGRTPEEAIANARLSLGENESVRCWKVRTRGAFGFFAKECFIAGTVAPTGVARVEEPLATRIANSTKDRAEVKSRTRPRQRSQKDANRPTKESFVDLVKMFSGASRNATTEKSDSSALNKSSEKPSFLHKQTYGQAKLSGTRELSRGLPGGLSIEDLVADTKDEVMLGLQGSGDIDFSAILREAEATIHLAMADQIETDVSVANYSLVGYGSDAESLDQSVDYVEERSEVALCDQSDPNQLDRTTEFLPTYETAVKVDLIKTDEVASIATCLRDLGVTQDYFSNEGAILDSLVRSISNIPKSRELPRTDGSVIAVIGNRSLIEGVAATVSTYLGLGDGDVVLLDRTNKAAKGRVTKRKTMKKVTVVAIEAPLRARELEEISNWVEMLEPDYVIGAVSASAKRCDVVSWFNRMRLIDSLAIANLTGTSTPFEMLGLPVLFIENHRASTLRWISLMLNTLAEDEK